jgi:hypothetical protein
MLTQITVYFLQYSEKVFVIGDNNKLESSIAEGVLVITLTKGKSVRQIIYPLSSIKTIETIGLMK